MLISPFFMPQRTLSIDAFLLILFAFSIIVFPAILFPETTRWSTIFYSLMFCFLFISYDSMLRRGYIALQVFLNILRYLIIAYTLVLIIQQICVFFGLPIFNISNYDPSNPWKLNSLAAEPSHSARIVGLLMLAYILGTRLAHQVGIVVSVTKKQVALTWLCFFWTMTTMLSSTALIMIGLNLLIYGQKDRVRNSVLGLVFGCGALFLLPDELIERVFNLALAFLTFDHSEVLQADHSGAMRLAPMLVLVDKVEFFSLEGLFGNGVDSVSFFMSDYIYGVREGVTGGGLLMLWYEYGLITFLLFSFFTLKTTTAMKSPVNFLIWFLLIFIAGVNNQMVWLTIILLHTLNVYRKRPELTVGRGQVRSNGILECPSRPYLSENIT